MINASTILQALFVDSGVHTIGALLKLSYYPLDSMDRRNAVKHIAAGTFKARCLAVMKKVQATGEPVIVTKRGTPVDIFGFMMGKVKIVGDIESPIPAEWESATK